MYALVLTGSGLALIVEPSLVASSGLGLVRSMVALLLVLAGYYRVAAVHDFRPFMVATVWGRGAMAGFQAVAIFVGWLEAPSWGGVVLDAASAVWTWVALKADDAQANPRRP